MGGRWSRSVVIKAAGAGLTNAIFMRREAIFVELYPDFHWGCFARMAGQLGLRYFGYLYMQVGGVTRFWARALDCVKKARVWGEMDCVSLLQGTANWKFETLRMDDVVRVWEKLRDVLLQDYVTGDRLGAGAGWLVG